MFRWIQHGVAGLLQRICGHGWTGGVEGALPFAIGCSAVFAVDLVVWLFLFFLPVVSSLGFGYAEKPKRTTPVCTGSHGSAPLQSHGLPTGSIIHDTDGNSCCARCGGGVDSSRPDGTEEQVYASEFDSTNSLTTSGDHHYNY